MKNHLQPTILEQVLVYLVVITLTAKIQVNFAAISALFVFWVLNKRYLLSIERLKSSKIFLCLCAHLSMLIISLLYTSNVSYGLKTLDTKASLLLLPVLLSGVYWNKNFKNNILKLFVVVVVLTTLYSLVTTIEEYQIDFSDLAYFSWVLPATSQLIANYYALFVSFAIIILILDFKEFKTTISKPAVLLLIIYLSVFLAFLSSRSAILGLVVIMILFAFSKITSNSLTERRKGFAIFLFTLFMGTALIAFVPYLKNRFHQTFVELKNDPRINIFESGIDLFLKNPVLGVGIGDIRDELAKEYLANNHLEAYKNRYNLHNDWLHVLVSTGLIGFLVFLYFFYQLFRQALRERNSYMISFLVFYSIVSLTESILERNKGVVFFSFFFTLIFILDLFQTSKNGHLKEVHQPKSIK